MTLLSERSRYAVNPIQEDDAVAERLRAQGREVIKLNRGDPAVYFPTPRHVVDAYIEALKDDRTWYSSGQGIPELREAVARRYKRMYNIDFGGENVMISNGVSEAVQFLNAMFIDRGDRAVLFRPYYTIYMPDLKMCDGEAILERYDESREWQINVESLRKSVSEAESRKGKVKYMLITNPNNPTGTVLSRKVLEEIVEVAKDHDILLISDEIYDEIVYNEAKFTSISELAKGMPHIILNGASKDFDATGFRIGFVIIPESDRVSQELLKKSVEFGMMRLSANTPAQYAVAAGLNGVSEHSKAVRAMTKEIESRVNFVERFVNNTEYMRAIKPMGAYYIFPRLEMSRLKFKSDKEFVLKLLVEEGVQLTRGSGFGEPDHIRIVALPPKEVLEKAMDKINNFCERHKR